MAIRKAVIMGGGSGQRLSPLSDYIPKCYLPIYDKPLLIKQIEWLQMAGVTDIIMTINDRFCNIFSNIMNTISVDNMKIDIVIESGTPGIACALLDLEDKIDEKQFLFLLGDEYFDNPSFFRAIGQLENCSNILGITSYSDIEQISQGCNLVLDEEKKQVLKLIEKPRMEEIIDSWCWNGAAVFDKSLIEEIRLIKERTTQRTNKILIDAINERIKQGIVYEYIKDNSNNINLTNLEDYYKAFTLEYKSRKR